MYNTVRIKKDGSQSGFTLIEISIVLIVIGFLIAPAVMIYRNYDKQKKWEKTESSLSLSLTGLGGFRSNFGRYPCPAPLGGVGPGDAGYGLESRTPSGCVTGAPGTCSGGLCFDNNPAGQLVIRGALPFKTLDLQENEAYDGYLSRMTYAVTAVLTDSTTFDPNKGAIGLVNASDVSLIKPANSLHFMVVSPGINGAGGFARSGVQGTPCPAGTPEEENCDADTIYRQAPHSQNFDDRVVYFSSVEISQWQQSESNPDHIHLKYGNDGNVAIGVRPTVDLTGAESLVVRDTPSEPGVVSLEASAAADYELMHSFNVSRLCEYGTANPAIDCFNPGLIGGQIATGGGMSCGAGEFIVGLKNRAPVCKDEIFVSCPAGQYVVGVVGGKIECSIPPATPCADKSVTTFCGSTATLAGTFSGGTSAVYSGTSYKLPNHTKLGYQTATAGMTIPQKIDYVSKWNDVARTADVANTSTKGLAKDIYQCNAGVWTKLRTHERKFGPAASAWPLPGDTTAYWAAEQTIAWSWSLDAGGKQVAPDGFNTSGEHDCWCREDYRARAVSCGVGFTGSQLLIEKVSCPNTNESSRWVPAWYDAGLPFADKSGCVCAPGDYPVIQSCAAYFGVASERVNGNVTVTTHKDCVSPDTTTTSLSCTCNAKPPIVTETPCPKGKTNSFTWNGIPKVGIASIKVQKWICPKGDGKSVKKKEDVGYWDSAVEEPGIPACNVCDTSLTDIEEVSCSTTDPMMGGTITYKKEWNCALNDWEIKDDWEEISRSCAICKAKAPTTAPTYDDRDKDLGTPGYSEGTACACGSTVVCHRDVGGNKYDIWNSCSCMPN